MPFVPFPTGTMSALLRGTLSGIPFEMGFGVLKPASAATPVDGAQVGSVFAAWATTGLGGGVSTQVNFTECVVNDLTSSSGWQASTTIGISGTAAGTVVPNQVALSVTFQTAKRGRSFRGRVFVPGLTQPQLTNSFTWSPATLTSFDGVFNSLDGQLNASGYSHVVLSRIQNKTVLALGEATLVLNVRANPRVATQRGRTH